MVVCDVFWNISLFPSQVHLLTRFVCLVWLLVGPRSVIIKSPLSIWYLIKYLGLTGRLTDQDEGGIQYSYCQTSCTWGGDCPQPLPSLSPSQKPQSCLVRPRPLSLTRLNFGSPLSPLVGVVLLSCLHVSASSDQRRRREKQQKYEGLIKIFTKNNLPLNSLTYYVWTPL